MVFSHAYRLRRADGNGASVEYRLVSRAASALFLLRLANAIARPVIVGIRPVSSYRRAGRSGGSSLLACGDLCGLSRLVPVVGLFLSYSSAFARAVAFPGCLVLLASPYAFRISLGVAAWSVISVPRAVPLPVSLRFVIRPVFRHGGRGDVLRRLSSAGSSLVLVACRPWGVVSAWRVIIMGRSRRAGVLCGLRGVGGCLPFLWYIGIVNWLYISFDWFFDMAGLPAATVIGFECSLIDNAILIEIGGGELPILEPDKAIKYAGLAASRIADFVLAHDYRIPDYLKAAVFLDDGNPRLARAIRFVVDSLRVP